MTPDTFQKINELYDRMDDLLADIRKVWTGGIVLTWQWWLLLAMAVIPWALWALYRRKESTDRLLYAGLFSVAFSSLLDAIGSALGLWMYTARLMPIVPPYFPWDTTLMPVAVMTLIQIKPKWNPLVKAAAFAATAAFVMEPLAEWMKLYEPVTWKHYYSFPIYSAIYLAADRLSRRKCFGRVSQA